LPKTTLNIWEATAVAVICFGLFILFSIEAVIANFPDTPFTNAGSIWGIGYELGVGLIAILFLHSRGFHSGSLILQPNFKGAVVGVGLFLAAWLVGAVITLPFSISQPEQPIDRIIDNTRLSMSVIVAFALVNGVFEEIFLIGVLVRGLRGYGLSVAIGLPLLIRVMFHLYQGPIGAIWILCFGLVFTVYYVRHGKLWPVVFGHILGDIVPFTSLAS
jgi:uncharacterized protein